MLLAGDIRAESWLRTLLQEEQPAQAYGRLLLAPGAQAPAGALAVQSRGRPVCSCMNVTDAAISGRLAHCHGSDAERLAQLQSALGCGTQCGSCVPELRRMVQACAPAALPAEASI